MFIAVGDGDLFYKSPGPMWASAPTGVVVKVAINWNLPNRTQEKGPQTRSFFVLDIEIAFGICEANAFHDPLECGIVVGVLAVFHPLSQQVTQDPAEVIMPGIA